MSPPLRPSSQMPDLQEDVFLEVGERAASDAIGTSSASMMSDASMMGHGVVLELRGGVHSSSSVRGAGRSANGEAARAASATNERESSEESEESMATRTPA